MLDFHIILITRSLHVSLNEAYRLLHATWLCQPTSSDYRDSVWRIARIALQRGVERVLLDVRKRSYIALSDQNWVLQKVLPLFRETHYRFAYLVNSQNLELMDTYRLQKEVTHSPVLQNRITIDLFLDEEEARLWLLGTGTHNTIT